MLRQGECAEVAAENSPVYVAASSKSYVDGRLATIENRLAKISAALAVHVQAPVAASCTPTCVIEDLGAVVKVAAKSYTTRDTARPFGNSIDCKSYATELEGPLNSKVDPLLVSSWYPYFLLVSLLQTNEVSGDMIVDDQYHRCCC
jgi:hypothetical protein